MSETGLKIRVFGEGVLRKKARRVGEITQKHRDILSSMSRAMYESSGIGLAAPQVGISEAMIVVDIGSGLYKLVNPKILQKEGKQAIEEGCLSVPGVCIKVKRANKVLVNAFDDCGKAVRIEAEGLLACVFQHEIDHLHGKLIVDYASLFDKVKIKNKLAELKKKAKNESLSGSKTKTCQLQL
jgi:peptide deformylase